MDADSRALIELLGPAIERAEQVGATAEALLKRQEESAKEFSTQLQETTRLSEEECGRLMKERSEVAALKAAVWMSWVARGCRLPKAEKISGSNSMP